MAIEAKATLLNEMERALAAEVTAAERDRIMAILTEALDGYDLTIVQQDGIRQDDLLDAYLSALAIEGRSAKTIERYRYLIGRMMAAVRTPTRKITVYHLRKYLSDEKARGISDRTLESTRQVFSAYFNWLQRERLIDQNPTANLGAIRYAKKEKDIYSDVDPEMDAFGVMFINEEKDLMSPVVYVRDVDTTYFEGSCASGTAAAAIAKAAKENDGAFEYVFRQPDGTLYASVKKKDGQVTEIGLGGIIEMTEILHVEV